MDKRKRVNILSLRRGRKVLMFCDDQPVSDEEQDKCLPLEITDIDRTSEAPDYVIVRCRSIASGQDLGPGRFDALTSAIMATSEDIARAEGWQERNARAEADGESVSEPLGVTASSSNAVMAVRPAGWPSFPKGQTLLPSQD